MRIGARRPALRRGGRSAGAELHARWIAQRLARTPPGRGAHHLRASTTSPGRTATSRGSPTVGGLPVRRFPVARRRTPEGFDELSSKVHFFEHTRRRGAPLDRGARAGDARACSSTCARTSGDYDALVFFSYRYWTTYHGLQVAPAEEHPGAHGRGRRRRAAARVQAVLPPARRRTRSTRPRRRSCSCAMTGAADLPGEVVGVGIEDAPVVAAGRDPQAPRPAGRLHRLRRPHRAREGLRAPVRRLRCATCRSGRRT